MRVSGRPAHEGRERLSERMLGRSETSDAFIVEEALRGTPKLLLVLQDLGGVPTGT